MKSNYLNFWRLNIHINNYKRFENEGLYLKGKKNGKLRNVKIMLIDYKNLNYWASIDLIQR